MIKVVIPSNNLNERKYILDIIFKEFLGIEYDLEFGSSDYTIEINNKKLVIKDTFFNKYPKDLEYLKLENIPSKIEDLDIFAASFFMLTRWEEYVNPIRDKHNRFPATESLAVKEGFWNRPIVNELLEDFKNKLLVLDSNLVFKKKEFSAIATHDVDYTRKWPNSFRILKHLLGDMVLRRSGKLFLQTISYYLDVKRGKRKDPFDTFEYLMDISDQARIKSYFFFMGKGVTRYDNKYKISSSQTKELITHIKSKNHIIGIHPTYNAYKDGVQFKKEKDEIEKICDVDIFCGREHYLRFEVPTTWQIWEENWMKWDSTLGYTDRAGFRCGVCYEYSAFNILTRKKLKLKEKPLIAMDVSVIYGKDISAQEMKKLIKNSIKEVKKYNGEFVFLWHNSSFNTEYWIKYANVYEEVLMECKK